MPTATIKRRTSAKGKIKKVTKRVAERRRQFEDGFRRMVNRHLRREKFRVGVLGQFARKLIKYISVAQRKGLSERNIRNTIRRSLPSIKERVTRDLLIYFTKGIPKEYRKIAEPILRKTLSTALWNKQTLNLVVSLAVRFPNAKPRDIAVFAIRNRGMQPGAAVSLFGSFYKKGYRRVA